MNKTEIENRYSKHQLTITSIDDFSDEIEFTYFKEKAKEVVTASLIVDLRNETPEQKLAYFFSSIESAKSLIVSVFVIACVGALSSVFVPNKSSKRFI